MTDALQIVRTRMSASAHLADLLKMHGFKRLPHPVETIDQYVSRTYGATEEPADE